MSKSTKKKKDKVEVREIGGRMLGDPCALCDEKSTIDTLKPSWTVMYEGAVTKLYICPLCDYVREYLDRYPDVTLAHLGFVFPQRTTVDVIWTLWHRLQKPANKKKIK